MMVNLLIYYSLFYDPVSSDKLRTVEKKKKMKMIMIKNKCMQKRKRKPPLSECWIEQVYE
jgi:hypothetical protein